MKFNEIGFLISRTFALFYFFKTAYLLFISVVPLFFQDLGSVQIYLTVWSICSIVGLAFLSCLFWFGAEKIGNAISGKYSDKSITSLSHEYFISGIFLAFGCLLISYTLPDISEIIATMLSDEAIKEIKIQNLNLIEKLTNILLCFTLALIFIFGASGLKNLVLKVRSIGANK